MINILISNFCRKSQCFLSQINQFLLPVLTPNPLLASPLVCQRISLPRLSSPFSQLPQSLSSQSWSKLDADGDKNDIDNRSFHHFLNFELELKNNCPLKTPTPFTPTFCSLLIRRFQELDLVRNDNYVSKLSQIFSIAISPDLERTSRLLQPLAGRFEDFTIHVSNLSNFTSMCMCIFLSDPSPIIGYPCNRLLFRFTDSCSRLDWYDSGLWSSLTGVGISDDGLT